jgi:hypothetical protein
MSGDKQVDYLEVDESIPGQNYVCLSFISPESLVQKKEAFKCAKFLQSFCKDQKMTFKDAYSKYEDFCYKHEDKLQRDYDEQNDFQTSIRGVKVRGVFNTKDEAEEKAKKISQLDSSFHVFIGQVGYWLPWDPNADRVDSEHFQNDQLNTMMSKYQENSVNRDIFYEEQKREKVRVAQEKVLEEKRKADLEREKKLDDVYEDDECEPEPEECDPEPEECEPKPEGCDPEPDESDPEPEECEPKPEECDPEPEECDGVPEECDPEPGVCDGVPEESDGVDPSLKESLTGVDPWLQRKTGS